MEFYRCRCGQPLAAFVTGAGSVGLPISGEYVVRQVREALARHLATVAAAGEPTTASASSPVARHGLAGVEPGLALAVELGTLGSAEGRPERRAA